MKICPHKFGTRGLSGNEEYAAPKPDCRTACLDEWQNLNMKVDCDAQKLRMSMSTTP